MLICTPIRFPLRATPARVLHNRVSTQSPYLSIPLVFGILFIRRSTLSWDYYSAVMALRAQEVTRTITLDSSLSLLFHPASCPSLPFPSHLQHHTSALPHPPPPSFPSSHSYIAALALATAPASAFFSLLPSVSLLSAFFLQTAFAFASASPDFLLLQRSSGSADRIAFHSIRFALARSAPPSAHSRRRSHGIWIGIGIIGFWLGLGIGSHFRFQFRWR
jgi:hypothetical protein